MRKVLSISLLCLYLMASAGLSITAHYCGGNLASLALFEKASCCCDDEQEEDDCCKNEVKTIKISDDQLKVEPSKKVYPSPDQSLDVLLSKHTFSFSNRVLDIVQMTLLPKIPEHASQIPLYKQNHSFLFYC